MSREIFSNHIGNASELTLLADIKPGFVPIPQPLTYAARLRAHLKMLSALRRNGLESDRAGTYVGPIDMLETLQYVRWTLVENDTKMLLAVNFDRPFEPYVRKIVDLAGPLLDTILCHCVGFEGHSSDQGFDVFMEYAMRHQVPVELFAAASPNLSVNDGDYYLGMDRYLRDGFAKDVANQQKEKDADRKIEESCPDILNTKLTKLRVQTPQEKLVASKRDAKIALLDQGLNILRVMYENAERFPKQDEKTRDDFLYFRLTNSLVPELFEDFAKSTSVKPNDPVSKPFKTWQQAVLSELVKSKAELPAGATPSQRRATARVKQLLETFIEPLAWFAASVDPREVDARSETLIEDMIQPGLLRQAPTNPKISIPANPFRATHACLLLLRIDDSEDGAKFLGAMENKIWPDETHDHSVNLSITHSGLKSLDVPEDIRLKFPLAFREGMADRAGLLGDTDCNHPKEWSWPVRNWPSPDISSRIAPATIDLTIRIEIERGNGVEDPPFDEEHPLFGQVTEIAELAERHNVKLLHVEAMQRRADRNSVQGHLKFADGISQPDYGNESEDKPKQPWDEVKLGDLLLGHQTKLDKGGAYPRYVAPLQNGTFQVVRKLKQDVAAFHKQAEEIQAKPVGVTPEIVMTKMVGRERDGSNFATGRADNEFDYEKDSDGGKTPLQSHIRRLNPRKKDTPRILRRGFSYGPFTDEVEQDDGVDRGQIFIAYNANIAEQFEVLQRWISGGNSTSISSWHGDPLLAPKRPDGSRTFRFLHDKKAVSVNLDPKPMATLQWGFYAFTPSRNGLNALATGRYSKEDVSPSDIAETSELVKTKLFLEDPDDENRDKRDAFWKEVRDRRKPKDLGEFGFAVGCAHQVRAILENKGDQYSVEEYRERMKDTIGVQYLGVDDREQHDKERVVLSKFLNIDLTEKKMFAAAYEVASAYIDAQNEEFQSLERDGYESEALVKWIGKRLQSKAFIHSVTAQLSARWFGIPSDVFSIGGPQQGEKPHCPKDFLAASYYLFTPHPTDYCKTNSEKRTPVAVNALRQHIENSKPSDFDPDSLLGKLVAENDLQFWTSQKMAEYVSGSCFGLVGPVTGSFRSVFFDWIKEDKLWRLQQRTQENGSIDSLAAASKILRPEILNSMSERPIADLLFRKTLKTVNIDGQTIPAGSKVVFSQRSAILDSDDAETFLFGGDYNESDDMMHKCPGKTMGLAILMGSFAAMMDAGTLQPEGPLSVRIKKFESISVS